jgi:coenzyme F420-reducing hydrogenase beta subunit
LLPHDCYGCGVCATICPLNIVKIKINHKGFYEPYITDKDKCKHCGLCLSICPYNKKQIKSNNLTISPKGYAVWSKDKNIRRTSSSGGMVFEIGKIMLSKEYKVLGVRYNPIKERAEHYMAANLKELTQSVGSKYVQSYTYDGFSQLNNKGKYFVTGTPCQIDSIRSLICQKKIEEHFILLDFFCHGVPSILLWKKYLKEVKKTSGRIISVSWRDKRNGWHDPFVMNIIGERCREKTYYCSQFSNRDMFYKYYLGNMCLNEACYSACKYKYLTSSADIRVGDLWGKKYDNNEDGVNGVITFTEKGEDILKELPTCTVIEENINIVTEGQIKDGIKKPYYYLLLNMLFKTKISLKVLYTIVQILRIGTLLKYQLEKKRKS